MNKTIHPSDIRQAQADNPRMRSRDLASQLGISEAQYVAAWCGIGTVRLRMEFDGLFSAFASLGEVMALTRNESAVHEKVGVYDNFVPGKMAAMMLGEAIDMRMFPGQWVHGFAVETRDGETVRRSLQFFDRYGEAIHKIHARPATDLKAWSALVASFAHEDQSEHIELEVRQPEVKDLVSETPVDELRERWSKMTDTHQFFGILRSLRLDRLQALRDVGEDFSWQIDTASIHEMLTASAEQQLAIMCFVNNPGCIQIHSGTVTTISEMGPWLNVLDPGFNLHLRQDQVREVWAVRKPTDTGHVTSLEAYDANGELIVQFFGKRKEGQDELQGWRQVMENLPRASDRKAA